MADETSLTTMAVDGAAVAAAAQPPRYAGPVGAWPDATLASLLTLPHTADPSLPDLLQDASQRAEAQQIVAKMASNPEVVARLRALLAEAPRHFENNDHEFATSSLATSGAHGDASPAAQLLSALLVRCWTGARCSCTAPHSTLAEKARRRGVRCQCITLRDAPTYRHDQSRGRQRPTGQRGPGRRGRCTDAKCWGQALVALG